MLPLRRDNRIRVLLADDSEAIRKAIRTLLDAGSEFYVVGEVSINADLVPRIRNTHPEVLILDLHMCVERGVMPSLKEFPGLDVIVVSALVGRESMELAARLGVKEVLEKVDLPTSLVSAIKNTYSQRHARNVRDAAAS